LPEELCKLLVYSGGYLSSSENISLRDRLRLETADAHARVDALFGSCDFADAADYGRFLLAQATAWETLRPMLDAESLRRADALRSDLDALGLAVPEPLADIAMPPRESLGHRYVLEGSRLGSTVLLRELCAKAPPSSVAASAYLNESARIDAWKQLSTNLQNGPGVGDNERRIINDALFVFGLFEKAWRATDSAYTRTGLD